MDNFIKLAFRKYPVIPVSDLCIYVFHATDV